jgi:hypothetical protein
MNAETEHAQTVLEIVLPDGLVPFLEILSAPHVIDEDVEMTLLGANAIDQLCDLVSDEVIDPNGDAVPPAAETSSAVSSMVSGRAYSDCWSRVVRPVT